MINKTSTYLISTIIFTIIILTIYVYVTNKTKPEKFINSIIPTKKEDTIIPTSCTKSDHIDPVNEPDYNMREVIKNTILIEQHLSDIKKYCKHCLIKHFLLSIGLIEEAIWMAENKIDNYPYLQDSKKIYTDIFENWRTGKATREETLHLTREWRQKVLPHYFPISKST
jgi:hypothetical protein